ncbi:sesquipedalian-1-like [Saccostrea cucullata]|uniref:sesquipedalian-1-like n=1 Tax=Saccostrea cuccullata TaxID=36930 RepID=UPI002ED01887
MRINEKSLSKFASSGAPADKEGYLLKKGELNKGYQKRYFVLKGNLLFYYEKRYEKEPVGVIILEGCTIELSENIDGFAFQIVFPKTGCRTYHMAADSQEEMEAWMKVLSCASYDYMKLMVSELKQQLEELKENSQQQLLENAMRDSHLVSSSYSPVEDKDESLSLSTSQRRVRFNPFNDPTAQRKSESKHLYDSIDEEHGQVVKGPPKKFLQLHEEYGQQVKTLSELWRGSFTERPASAFELTTTHSSC